MKLPVPVVVVPYVVGVHVEDKLTPCQIMVFLRCRLVFGLVGVDVVDIPENVVHREERGRHAAVRPQIGSTAHPLTPGASSRSVLNQTFDSGLLPCLWWREAFTA